MKYLKTKINSKKPNETNLKKTIEFYKYIQDLLIDIKAKKT